MLKNVLEANGIKISWVYLSSIKTHTLYLYKIDNKEYIYATDINHEILYNEIEQACKQYVRENGFKLEWLLKDITPHQYELYDYDVNQGVVYEKKLSINDVNGDEAIQCSINHLNKIEYLEMDSENFVKLPENIFKLIAWLYSEDIKIVEE